MFSDFTSAPSEPQNDDFVAFQTASTNMAQPKQTTQPVKSGTTEVNEFADFQRASANVHSTQPQFGDFGAFNQQQTGPRQSAPPLQPISAQPTFSEGDLMSMQALPPTQPYQQPFNMQSQPIQQPQPVEQPAQSKQNTWTNSGININLENLMDSGIKSPSQQQQKVSMNQMAASKTIQALSLIHI